MSFDKKLNPALAAWRKSATQITNRVGKTVGDVLTSPAVLFGAGVCAWSYQVSGATGFWTNVAITSASAVTRGYESWTGRKKGVPYFVRAAANAVTVGSIFEHGVSTGALHLHVDNIRELWQPVKSVVLPAASSLLAGVANGIQGLHEFRKTKPKGTIDDPMFYVGLCDPPAAVGIHGFSLKILTPFAVGFGKSFFAKTPANDQPESWREFAAKHATPARFYTVGWGIAAFATNIANPGILAAETCWTGAFAFWDEKENREFVPDAKHMIGKSLHKFSPKPQ